MASKETEILFLLQYLKLRNIWILRKNKDTYEMREYNTMM